MKLITAILTFAFAVSANPTHKVCNGIVEENDMYISVSDQRSGGLTLTQFNEVIDKATKVYNPEFVAKNAIFKVQRNWDDGTVNAYAQQFGNTWQVSMFGGLARHETITRDGFMLVICHEIGHHLGGAPKKGGLWASNEGQADYFANLKCLRKVFEDEDNEKAVSNMQVDAFAKQECEQEFSDRKEQLVCMRGAMAGLSVANLFKALRKETRQPDFFDTDKNVVLSMNHNHPATQCRLDTYFNGSRCTVAKEENVSDIDYKIGTCDTNATFNTGSRPKCWFKN